MEVEVKPEVWNWNLELGFRTGIWSLRLETGAEWTLESGIWNFDIWNQRCTYKSTHLLTYKYYTHYTRLNKHYHNQFTVLLRFNSIQHANLRVYSDKDCSYIIFYYHYSFNTIEETYVTLKKKIFILLHYYF